VARLGGDEFVLVLHGLDNRNEIDRFCARLIERLQQPILFDDQPCTSAPAWASPRPAPRASMPAS
jgi:GGDEF domain-containing protein